MKYEAWASYDLLSSPTKKHAERLWLITFQISSETFLFKWVSTGIQS